MNLSRPTFNPRQPSEMPDTKELIFSPANASFVYDGDGKRVKGTVNGTTIVYIGNYYEWGGTPKKYYYAGAGAHRHAHRHDRAEESRLG